MATRFKIPRAEFVGFAKFYGKHLRGVAQNRQLGRLSNLYLAIGLAFLVFVLCAILAHFVFQLDGRGKGRVLALLIFAPFGTAYTTILLYNNRTLRVLLSPMVQFLGWHYEARRRDRAFLKQISKSSVIPNCGIGVTQELLRGEHLGFRFKVRYIRTTNIPLLYYFIPLLLLTVKTRYALIYSIPIRDKFVGQVIFCRDDFSGLNIGSDNYQQNDHDVFSEAGLTVWETQMGLSEEISSPQLLNILNDLHARHPEGVVSALCDGISLHITRVDNEIFNMDHFNKTSKSGNSTQKLIYDLSSILDDLDIILKKQVDLDILEKPYTNFFRTIKSELGRSM